MITSIDSSSCISIAAISHIGNSRDNNEDNFLIPPHTILLPEVRDHMSHDNPMAIYDCVGGRRCICAVSDGMGGQAAGELASIITVDYLSKHSDELINAVILGAEQVKTTIYALNQEVCRYAAAESNRKGMGATLSAVIVNNSTIFGVHIGDSRIYCYRDHDLKQLTVDHTEGQRLIDLNLISDDELTQFPYRKALYKHIGMNGNIVLDVFPIDGIIPGTIIMLCTDGLSDVLNGSDIEGILSDDRSSIEDKAQCLISLAVKQNINYGDNTTLVLLEF